MSRKIDLTGQTFGRLTVVAEAGRDKEGRVLWRCRCSCGEECLRGGKTLRSGQSQSCGCLSRERLASASRTPSRPHRRAVAPVGQTFGNLTVIGERWGDAEGRMFWLCRCDCGSAKAMKPSNVKSGRSQSCGCARSGSKYDLVGQRFGHLAVAGEAGRDETGRVTWLCVCDCGGQKEVAGSRLVRGEATSCGCRPSKMTHGQSGTPLYIRWQAMVRRCENPNATAYAEYGGRGISVCSEWRDYENFAADMGPTFRTELTLDRIDVNGNYEPRNCRWVTNIVQQRNKRTNRFLTFRGRTLTVAEWADLLGLQPGTIRHRLAKSRWPIERALTEGANPEALSALEENNR